MCMSGHEKLSSFRKISINSCLSLFVRLALTKESKSHSYLLNLINIWKDPHKWNESLLRHTYFKQSDLCFWICFPCFRFQPCCVIKICSCILNVLILNNMKFLNNTRKCPFQYSLLKNRSTWFRHMNINIVLDSIFQYIPLIFQF